MPGETMLKARDVALILDCSPDDVLAFRRRGKLPATNFGKGVKPFWRFKKADVLKFKKGQAKA